MLDRLRSANLTAKPFKFMIGYDSIDYFGHNIVDKRYDHKRTRYGLFEMFLAIIRKGKFILGLAVFLSSFYSRLFVHSFSFDGFNKGEQTDFYQRLERLPFFRRRICFVFHTGASDIVVGTVLLQKCEVEGRLPKAYASKTLLPRERHYSVIEKECLGII